jgi:hypothetical protein
LCLLLSAFLGHSVHPSQSVRHEWNNRKRPRGKSCLSGRMYCTLLFLPYSVHPTHPACPPQSGSFKRTTSPTMFAAILLFQIVNICIQHFSFPSRYTARIRMSNSVNEYVTVNLGRLTILRALYSYAFSVRLLPSGRPSRSIPSMPLAHLANGTFGAFRPFVFPLHPTPLQHVLCVQVYRINSFKGVNISHPVSTAFAIALH